MRLRWLIIRAVRVLMTLSLSSFVVFGAIFLAPGNPIALLTGGRTLPPQQLAYLEAEYHLRQPFFERYWHWLGAVLHGDLGQSIVSGTSVSSLIGARIGTTIFLVLYAAMLIVVLGVALGLAAGVRAGRTDNVITLVTTIGLATPSFVVAIVLITGFAVGLGWFPVFGGGGGFLDRLVHLTLPAIALAVSGIAYVAQTTRAAVRRENDGDHTHAARSRGIPERFVIRRHVLRNALIPIITVSGLSVAALVAGVAVIENAFGVAGVGSYLIQAVQEKDYAVVQAVCLILVSVFIVVNAVVDALYYLIDPRLRSA